MTDDKQPFADKLAATNPELFDFASRAWWGPFAEATQILFGLHEPNDEPIPNAFTFASFFQEGYKAAGGGDRTMREAFQYANHQLLQANKTLTNQALVFAKHQLEAQFEAAELGIFTTPQLRALSAALQISDQGDFTQGTHADIEAARVIITHALELRKSRG